MATHVKVVGTLFLAFGVMWALAAVFSRLILTFVAHLIATSGDPDAAVGATILGFAGIAVTVICGLFAVAYLSTGWGVLKLRPWGRILGIVMAAVSLIKFPFGGGAEGGNPFLVVDIFGLIASAIVAYLGWNAARDLK